MTNPPQKAAHLLAAAADLLDQGQIINRLSLAVTAIAIGVLLLPVFPASVATVPTAAVVAVAGLLELYLATQVNLNAGLLRRLAHDAEEGRLDVASFDSALLSLGLRSKKTEPVARRFAGTRRLLIWQALALSVQVIAAIAGGSDVYWNLA